MKKTILLAIILSLLFGIAQANTYKPGEARLCLLTSSTVDWDTIWIQLKDSAGVVLEDTFLTGGGLRAQWAYTVGAWDGQITEEAKMKLSNGDSLRTADIYIVRPIPETGDTIKNFLVKGDTTACQAKGFAALSDSNSFKAKGFAVPGDSNTFKAKGYAIAGDAMTLTTGERASIADSIWLSPEALNLLMGLAGADSMKAWRPDSLVYYYGADSTKKIFTITNGEATKWITR